MKITNKLGLPSPFVSMKNTLKNKLEELIEAKKKFNEIKYDLLEKYDVAICDSDYIQVINISPVAKTFNKRPVVDRPTLSDESYLLVVKINGIDFIQYKEA